MSQGLRVRLASRIVSDGRRQLSGAESLVDSGGEPRPDTAMLTAVYRELRALASAYLRNERPDHTLQTTALVHEAWLRLSDRDASTFDSRAHYFRAAALAMRRILLHDAERKRAFKRGGGQRGIPLQDALDPASNPTPSGIDLLALDEALNRLAAADAQKARVVELRYFAGCSVEETAEALEISVATVGREWRLARAWLRTQLVDNGDHSGPPANSNLIDGAD